MNILETLVQLRDDLKTWVTNNLNILNTKIDNKLDSGALPGAINNAIAQAKESGDLKGEKGDDGISATHSWNGTTLTITSASGTSSVDLKGEKGDDGIPATHSWSGTTLRVTSASGTSSANLKGDKGDKGDTGANGQNGSDGYTPVRGTDYWTDADKAEIKAYVDEAILGGAW